MVSDGTDAAQLSALQNAAANAGALVKIIAPKIGGFKDSDGKRIVLRGMSTGAPRIVSAKRMERIFRHGEVAFAAECLITTRKDSEG